MPLGIGLSSLLAVGLVCRLGVGCDSARRRPGEGRGPVSSVFGFGDIALLMGVSRGCRLRSRRFVRLPVRESLSLVIPAKAGAWWRYRFVDTCVARLPLTQRAFRLTAVSRVTFLCWPKEK
jgi:hypothetical protein